MSDLSRRSGQVTWNLVSADSVPSHSTISAVLSPVVGVLKQASLIEVRQDCEFGHETPSHHEVI